MNDMMIPADSARWFVRQMLRSGLSHEQLFGDTLPGGQWMKLTATGIPMSQYLRIVLNALDATGDPGLGLTIGKGQNLFEYGVWGYAIMSCATAGEAMNVAFRYWELNGSLVNVSVKRSDRHVIWSISPAFTVNDPRLLRFAVEEFVSTTAAACDFLFGQPFTATALHLSYPAPDYADLYPAVTRCPVHFQSESSALILDNALMDLPTVTGHLDMKNHCESLCEEMLHKLSRADKLIETIRQIFITSMGRFPKAEDMAQKLSMSPRTLYRRLSERNTSFQAILDEVRAELAMSYLEHTHLSIDQISDLIGFMETTTFRRAFKKWTGASPSEYKKTLPDKMK